MKNQNYRLKISYHDNGNIQMKYILDNEFNQMNGESICYYPNGNLMQYCYMRQGFFCGIVKSYEANGVFSNFSYFSMIEKYKKITPEEYKKELVLLRLGEIEVPELDLHIKDFE